MATTTTTSARGTQLPRSDPAPRASSEECILKRRSSVHLPPHLHRRRGRWAPVPGRLAPVIPPLPVPVPLPMPLPIPVPIPAPVPVPLPIPLPLGGAVPACFRPLLPKPASKPSGRRCHARVGEIYAKEVDARVSSLACPRERLPGRNAQRQASRPRAARPAGSHLRRSRLSPLSWGKSPRRPSSNAMALAGRRTGARRVLRSPPPPANPRSDH